MAIKEISAFIDIPNPPIPEMPAQDLSPSLATLQVGSGDVAMKVSREGLHLGADKFEDAPFSVDMLGRMILQALGGSGEYLLIDAVNNRIIVHDGTNNRVVIGDLS